VWLWHLFCGTKLKRRNTQRLMITTFYMNACPAHSLSSSERANRTLIGAHGTLAHGRWQTSQACCFRVSLSGNHTNVVGRRSPISRMSRTFVLKLRIILMCAMPLVRSRDGLPSGMSRCVRTYVPARYTMSAVCYECVCYANFPPLLANFCAICPRSVLSECHR